MDQVSDVRDDDLQQAARQGAAGLPDLRSPFPPVGRGAAGASCSTRARGPSATPASSRSTGSGSSTRSRTRTGWPRRRPRPGCATRPSGGRPRWAAIPVAICVMDFGFMGGSMGAVVGEKVTRAAEHALEARIPLIVVSASGGARMQEGTLALMQLAKTLAALERLQRGRRPVPVGPVRPDDRRRLRLVRGRRRRQRRRAECADRVRRLARLGRDDRPGAAGRASSAPSSCSSTASSTGSSPGPSCATSWSRCSDLLPARAEAVPGDAGRPRHRDARLPAVLVPVARWPRRVGERTNGDAPPAAPTRTAIRRATRATTSGRASSSRATSPGRGRSSSSRR